MYEIAKVRSEAYAKSFPVVKDFYDDLIYIIKEAMLYGITKADFWPNPHFSSHYKGIMNAVSRSPIMENLYHQYWLWQHRGQSEWIISHLLDLGGLVKDKLGFETKTELEIQNAMYNWIIGNFYDVGGIDGIINKMEQDYQTFLDSIPDNLPSKPSIDSMINSIKRMTSSINNIKNEGKPESISWPTETISESRMLGDSINYARITKEKSYETAHGILTLVKDKATVSTFVTGAGAIGIKVVSLFTPLGAGWFVAEGILMTAAKITTGISLGATVADMFAIYFVGRCYAETIATSISDIGTLFEIWSDTIKATKKVSSDPSGNIVDLEIPNIVIDEDVAVGTGNLIMLNTNDFPIDACAYIYLYDTSSRNYMMFLRVPIEGTAQLAPGETRNCKFGFSVFRPLNGLSKYVAEAYLWFGQELVDKSITTFHVTMPDLIALSEAQTVTLLSDGLLGEFESIRASVHTGNNARDLKLIVFYPCSRLDLHIFDSSGRHVGFNYATGIVEQQIPGSYYSGINSRPQVVEIVGDISDQDYTIQVSGFQTFGKIPYMILAFETPSMEPVMDIYPRGLEVDNCANPKLDSITTFLTISELSGQRVLSNVHVW